MKKILVSAAVLLSAASCFAIVITRTPAAVSADPQPAIATPAAQDNGVPSEPAFALPVAPNTDGGVPSSPAVSVPAAPAIPARNASGTRGTRGLPRQRNDGGVPSVPATPNQPNCETVTVHIPAFFLNKARDVEVCKSAINPQVDEMINGMSDGMKTALPEIVNSSNIWVAKCADTLEITPKQFDFDPRKNKNLKNDLARSASFSLLEVAVQKTLGEKMIYGRYPDCTNVTQDTFKVGTLLKDNKTSDPFKTKVIRCCPQNRKPQRDNGVPSVPPVSEPAVPATRR